MYLHVEAQIMSQFETLLQNNFHFSKNIIVKRDHISTSYSQILQTSEPNLIKTNNGLILYTNILYYIFYVFYVCIADGQYTP